MKKQRILSGLLSLALAGTLVPTVAAVEPDDFYTDLAHLINQQGNDSYFDSMELTIGSETITLDGKTQQMDVAPVLRNDRTMLPIRAVAEAAGATVSYDSATQTVFINSTYGDEIECTVSSNFMTVNAELCSLDAPSYIENNRTYLPVRAVAEALQLDVEWVSETSTVLISAPYQTARVLAWSNGTLDTSELSPTAAIQDGDGLWVLQFANPAQAKQAVEVLQSRGITAEPDLYIPPVNDVENNEIQSTAHWSWGVADCKFDSFVSSQKLTGSGVVSVVDTGVDATHPFLKDRVLKGRDFVSGDNDPADEHYHGTHVAGTIIDCVGDAPVKILPVRVLNAMGSGYNSTVAAGIKYAADQGSDVINLSLGCTRFLSNSDVIDSAIDYAIKKGSLCVIAAGNNSNDTSWYCPSHLTTPGTVIVSAGDSKHSKAYFSNYGSNADLMAPGVSIKACTPKNSYKTLDGTSMAAPHVAAAAVLLDLAWEDSLTPAQLEEKVHTATTNGKWTDKYQGYGFLDMSKASVPASRKPDNEIKYYRYNVSKLSLKAGETARVTVYAVYSDGIIKDVTASAQLYSTNPGVATVNSNGTVTAVKEGTTYISMGSLSNNIPIPDPIAVTVTSKTPSESKLTGYRYNVSELSLKAGETARVTVTAVYSDGSIKDVTASAQLYSTNTNVATVNNSGTVTAVKEGTTRISINSAVPAHISIPKPITVTVNSPDGSTSYKRLFWGISNNIGDTAASITLAKGQTLKVAVYGETTDGRIVDLTKECEIYSGDPSVLTVSADGTVQAVKAGSTYLSIKSVPNPNLELPPILEIKVTD